MPIEAKGAAWDRRAADRGKERVLDVERSYGDKKKKER
jgi:hypothetical protein